jgi:hypothetical protein
MGNVYPHGRDRVECDIIDNEIMFTFERLRTSLSSQRGKKFFATAMVALFAIFMVMGSTEYAFAQGSGSVVPATTPAPAVTPTETTNNIVQSQANDRTSAACSGPVTGFICEGIASILGLVANLIGSMILLVISVLIAFAQYNGFSDAMPVVQGWIVVRDTTNMFFIIVLLLTAFATVIGRDEFHYEKVLPKLLLQAVLINFSKTLIQLLIDFSQVVMLTFVNAFAQSAAGNFVYALGLDKMMQFNPTGTTPAQFANIILAYGLAIFFMSIALGVVIILTCYLVYRIVALWITLILAPLAFFASALPEKLQRGMGAVTGEYWKRLTGLLTGGPVIAFFLWLTLAITQRSSQEANSQTAATGLSAALNLTRPSTGAEGGVAGAADSAVGATFGFITAIADSNHVISFVVGIALMLAALDTAVASAAAMGGLAGLIASKTKSFAKGVVKAPWTATKAGGRALKGAAKGTYNAVDRRYDLTRKASLLGTKALAKTPAMLRGETYDKARGGLLKGVNYRRAQSEKEASADAEYNKALASKAKSLDERKALLGIGSEARTQKEGFLLPPTMSAKATEAYYQEQFGDKDMIEKEYKATKTKYEAELKASGLSDSEAKAGSEVRVREELNERQRVALGARYDIAKSSGNEDEQKKIEELLKLNPHLARTGEERTGFVKKMIDSPELYKDIPKETYMNGEFLTDLMLANGWSEVKDASGKVTGIEETDKDAWDLKKKEMQRANSAAASAMGAHERFAKLSTDKTPDQLRKMQHVKNLADNTIHTYSINDDKTATPNMKAGTRVRNSSQTAALDASKRKPGDANTRINVNGMSDGMKYGASLTETLANAGYSANDQAPLQAFASQYIGADTASSIANINSDEAKLAETYQTMADIEVKDIDKAYTRDVKDITKDYTDQINAANAASNTAEVTRLAKERDDAIADMTKLRDQLLSEAKAKADPTNVAAVAKQSVRDGIAKAQEIVGVLSQTGTKGVGRPESEVLLGEFFKNGGVEIIKNIDRYDTTTKQRILAIVDKMKDIANDVSREGASGTNKAYQEMIRDAQDALIKELPKKGTGQALRKQITSIPNSDTTV